MSLAQVLVPLPVATETGQRGDVTARDAERLFEKPQREIVLAQLHEYDGLVGQRLVVVGLAGENFVQEAQAVTAGELLNVLGLVIAAVSRLVVFFNISQIRYLFILRV